VLLNFWATWCPPCIEELPSLNSIYSELRDRGLVVLGVSVDEDRALYQRFLTAHKVSFPTVIDPERSVSTRYGTFKYPESYLIDPEGIVIRKYVGAEDWQRPEIANYLRSLL
jgi:peroxiredoxin